MAWALMLAWPVLTLVMAGAARMAWTVMLAWSVVRTVKTPCFVVVLVIVAVIVAVLLVVQMLGIETFLKQGEQHFWIPIPFF